MTKWWDACICFWGTLGFKRVEIRSHSEEEVQEQERTGIQVNMNLKTNVSSETSSRKKKKNQSLYSQMIFIPCIPSLITSNGILDILFYCPGQALWFVYRIYMFLCTCYNLVKMHIISTLWSSFFPLKCVLTFEYSCSTSGCPISPIWLYKASSSLVTIGTILERLQNLWSFPHKHTL